MNARIGYRKRDRDEGNSLRKELVAISRRCSNSWRNSFVRYVYTIIKKKVMIRGNVYRFHERRHGHEISRDSTLSRRIFYIFLRTFEKNNGEITDSLSCINSIDLRHRENINSQ